MSTVSIFYQTNQQGSIFLAVTTAAAATTNDWYWWWWWQMAQTDDASSSSVSAGPGALEQTFLGLILRLVGCSHYILLQPGSNGCPFFKNSILSI